MRPPRSAATVVVAVVVLLAAVGFSTAWSLAADQLRDGVAAWIEARRAEGFVVAHQGLEISGFPFRLRGEIAAPELAAPNHPKAWAWKAGRLVVEGRPWDLTRLRVTLPAEQELRYRANPGGERVVVATVAGGVARLTLSRGVIAQVDLAASGLALSTADDTLRIARLSAKGRRAARDTLELSLTIDNLTLPTRWDGPMGREVARFAADATVAGPLRPGDLAAVLSAWSEAGGTVEIEALDLRWRDLTVAASGTLALDRSMRPQAALSAEITGYGAALAALAEGGLMKPSEAALTTIALNLLAGPGVDGVRVLRLPLAAQDGTLFVGPLALVKLPPVVRR